MKLFQCDEPLGWRNHRRSWGVRFSTMWLKWRQSRHTVITATVYISPVISCKKWIWIANDTRAPIRKGKTVGRSVGDGCLEPWPRRGLGYMYTPTRQGGRKRERGFLIFIIPFLHGHLSNQLSVSRPLTTTQPEVSRDSWIGQFRFRDVYRRSIEISSEQKF